MATLRSSSTPTSARRVTDRTMQIPSSSSTDQNLSSSPEHDSVSSMIPLTPQVTVESEGEVESETELPMMTPPPTRHLPIRLRNASPSRSGIRNGFNSNINNSITMPHMQRAHSSPGVDSSGRVVTPTQAYPRRPASPLSSGRRRSPLRTTFEEPYPAASWSNLNIEPNIPEHAELELSSPATPEHEYGSISSIPTYTTISNTLPRSRRRPASPLHQSASAPSLHTGARTGSFHSNSGTPPSMSVMSAAKYANEPYPAYGYSFSSTSSMPSTPTSLRSRSPSISSLETIEDTPDAEEAARMEEENTKQRGGEDVDGASEPRRKSLDLRAASLRSNKDRKRWSVCGAERRADFSLEPIEE